MITIINKTGRDLTIFSSLSDTIGRFFPADGAGVLYNGFLGRGKVETVDGIPVTYAAPAPGPVCEGHFYGLPEHVEGTYVIVAFPVENAASIGLGRTDLLRMGPARMSEGRQVGAEGFQSSLCR